MSRFIYLMIWNGFKYREIRWKTNKYGAPKWFVSCPGTQLPMDRLGSLGTDVRGLRAVETWSFTIVHYITLLEGSQFTNMLSCFTVVVPTVKCQ